MTIIYIILGGAIGGGLGWLFDRLTKRNQPEAVTEECEPRT